MQHPSLIHSVELAHIWCKYPTHRLTVLTASPCSPLCSLVHSETAAKFTKGTSSITSTNKRHRHTRRLRTNRTPKIAYHTNTGWMSTLDELGRRSRPCITKRFRKPASKPNHHCKIVKVCTHRIFFCMLDRHPLHLQAHRSFAVCKISSMYTCSVPIGSNQRSRSTRTRYTKNAYFMRSSRCQPGPMPVAAIT